MSEATTGSMTIDKPKQPNDLSFVSWAVHSNQPELASDISLRSKEVKSKKPEVNIKIWKEVYTELSNLGSEVKGNYSWKYVCRITSIFKHVVCIKSQRRSTLSVILRKYISDMIVRIQLVCLFFVYV